MKTHRNHVVIIDEDERIGNVMAELIKRYFPDAQVAAFTDGFDGHAEALKQEGKMALVICDLKAGRTNGPDTVGTFKKHWPSLPVILTTAGEVPPESKADLIIEKPWLVDQVLELVHTLTGLSLLTLPVRS